MVGNLLVHDSPPDDEWDENRGRRRRGWVVRKKRKEARGNALNR
jgi:hypothetical protein